MVNKTVNSYVKAVTSISEIYKPISADLLLVEEELKNLVMGFSFDSTKEVLEYFFKIPGKRLRPALLLLSARAVNNKISEEQNSQLIRMAAAMELIHAASLVHDDIIDEDLTRRGQKTLNKVFGNKIAVLAGDTLYTKAFLTISSQFPKDFMQMVTSMTENMCMAEIEQARGIQFLSTRDKYFRLIKNKTAIFMAYCCRFGASLTTSDVNVVLKMEKFGLNFGMTYQIVDDCADNDPIASRYVGLKDAEEFAALAEPAVLGLEDSIYKDSLLGLVSYIFSSSHV